MDYEDFTVCSLSTPVPFYQGSSLSPLPSLRTLINFQAAYKMMSQPNELAGLSNRNSLLLSRVVECISKGGGGHFIDVLLGGGLGSVFLLVSHLKLSQEKDDPVVG